MVGRRRALRGRRARCWAPRCCWPPWRPPGRCTARRTPTRRSSWRRHASTLTLFIVSTSSRDSHSKGGCAVTACQQQCSSQHQDAIKISHAPVSCHIRLRKQSGTSASVSCYVAGVQAAARGPEGGAHSGLGGSADARGSQGMLPFTCLRMTTVAPGIITPAVGSLLAPGLSSRHAQQPLQRQRQS